MRAKPPLCVAAVDELAPWLPHIGRLPGSTLGRPSCTGAARQAGQVGGQVEVVAHQQFGVVAGVVDALRRTAPKRGGTGAGQVVGMDVVGVHILSRPQNGCTALQPVSRVPAVTVGCINARDAQHRHHDAGAASEGTHLGFGMYTAPRAVGGGSKRAGLIKGRTGGIAIHTRCAGVNQTPHPTTACQRLQQGPGSSVLRALRRRWCQVQHGMRQSAQTAQREGHVKIAQQGRGAGRAQCRHAVRRRRERNHVPARLKQSQHTQADIATTYDQQSEPAGAGGGRGHKGGGVTGAGLSVTISHQFTCRAVRP